MHLCYVTEMCRLFFVNLMKTSQARGTQRSVEMMRKCRKPSQEDPAAVGPTQEQECGPVKENLFPSAVRRL